MHVKIIYVTLFSIPFSYNCRCQQEGALNYIIGVVAFINRLPSLKGMSSGNINKSNEIVEILLNIRSAIVSLYCTDTTE